MKLSQFTTIAFLLFCSNINIGQAVIALEEIIILPTTEDDSYEIKIEIKPLEEITSIHLEMPKGILKSGKILHALGEHSFHVDPHVTHLQNNDKALILLPANISEFLLSGQLMRESNQEWKIKRFMIRESDQSTKTLDDPIHLRTSPTCQCDPLPFQSRVDWDCPWGEDSTIFVPTYSELKHIVVHHQAGTALEPYDATVRSIWNFHVNGNGWSDIGYHWLIDPAGVLYKGRAWLNGDQNIQGAHMCACNANKLGVCLLGDLTTTGPTDEQLNALVQFIATKGCELDIEPIELKQGTSRVSGTCITQEVFNVLGHREGCPTGWTACPGDAFFPMLPDVIQEAQIVYDSCVDSSTQITDADAPILTIYPNPSYENISIHSSKIIDQVEAFALDGKLVMKAYPKSSKHTLNGIDNIGVILLKIYIGNDVTTHKVVFNN